MKNSTRTVKVDYLARVEGEGSLFVKIKGDKIEDVKFKIFEPPRFFEAFLRGRDYSEAPDIAARICGICPIAYQMSAVHAMERALGVTVDGQLRELRRLIYCGEWIESHALHIFMLHAPDFLGYEDAIQMAKDYGEIVKQGLALKKIGNDLVTIIGGREIHPVNVRVGGFYRVPRPNELAPMVERLEWARQTATETVRLVSGFTFPDFECDYEYVALRHASEYPFNEGRLVSSKGLDIDISEYEHHFVEEHVEHANALQSIHKGFGPYFVGPMARYNLNYDRLSSAAKDAAKLSGLGQSCNNPFKSIIVRSIELVYACDEALRIIRQYKVPDQSFVETTPKEGVGWGCTEAPRGICWHRYRLDDAGIIQDAKIVPPTSQNQRTIENDLLQFVQKNLHLSNEELTWQCEQAVRNYDPCISCATHSLKLHFVRE
jgi:sulfhydrogenase subunit alpha